MMANPKIQSKSLINIKSLLVRDKIVDNLISDIEGLNEYTLDSWLDLDKLEKFKQLKNIGFNNIVIVKNNVEKREILNFQNDLERKHDLHCLNENTGRVEWGPVVSGYAQATLPCHGDGSLSLADNNNAKGGSGLASAGRPCWTTCTQRLELARCEGWSAHRPCLTTAHRPCTGWAKSEDDINKVFLFLKNNGQYFKLSKKIFIPRSTQANSTNNIYFTIKFTTLKNLILETRLALYPQLINGKELNLKNYKCFNHEFFASQFKNKNNYDSLKFMNEITIMQWEYIYYNNLYKNSFFYFKKYGIL